MFDTYFQSVFATLNDRNQHQQSIQSPMHSFGFPPPDAHIDTNSKNNGPDQGMNPMVHPIPNQKHGMSQMVHNEGHWHNHNGFSNQLNANPNSLMVDPNGNGVHPPMNSLHPHQHSIDPNHNYLINPNYPPMAPMYKNQAYPQGMQMNQPGAQYNHNQQNHAPHHKQLKSIHSHSEHQIEGQSSWHINIGEDDPEVVSDSEHSTPGKDDSHNDETPQAKERYYNKMDLEYYNYDEDENENDGL